MTRNLIVRRIEFTERPVRFRMPFRFGAAKVEGAPQVFVHAGLDPVRVGTMRYNETQAKEEART